MMLEGASIRRSLSHFATNPLRTLLTLLGIVFGVGSVVAMVSVGEGAQREILATIEAMGGDDDPCAGAACAGGGDERRGQ